MGSYDNVLVSFNHDKIKIGFFFNFPTFFFSMIQKTIRPAFPEVRTETISCLLELPQAIRSTTANSVPVA